MVDFYRQLGEQPGVLVNRLQDDSVIQSVSRSDQVFATVARLTRGRIDRPIIANRGTLVRFLGQGESIRKSELNEAWAQVFEALNNGAQAVVIQRLIADDHVLKVIHVVKNLEAITFQVALEGESVENSILTIKHVECHNDGIIVSIHADVVLDDDGLELDTNIVTLEIRDPSANVLYQVTGSFDPDTKDDSGNSLYLPDVVAESSDALTIAVGDSEAIIATGSLAYGYGKEVASGVLYYFLEGSTGYTAANYAAACKKLKNTNYQFDYMVSGGTRSVALLVEMADVAYRRLAQFGYDIPGELSPADAIAFMSVAALSLRYDAYMFRTYWAPSQSRDRSGVNPVGYIGTAALNTALICKRNAEVNTFGLAPRNYPVAGKYWPLPRTGIRQMYFPDEDGHELSKLAMARINPVLFETYSDGSYCVFTDSLTNSRPNSLKKSMAVVDMASYVDKAVAAVAKEALQLPMLAAIKIVDRFLKKLFEAMSDSNWVQNSEEPGMDGKAFQYSAVADPNNPYDHMVVSYGVRYVGTSRKISITQTLKR
jgi:hypothetical protein